MQRANKAAIRTADARDIARAVARADASNARMEADQASGVEAFKERTRRMVAAKKKRDAEAAEAGDDADADDAPRVAEYMATPLVAPPPVAPPGATEASVAAELQRWPAPPGEASREVVVQAWPLYLDLSIWLDEMTAKYSFAEAGEALRHLVFLANGNPKSNPLTLTL